MKLLTRTSLFRLPFLLIALFWLIYLINTGFTREDGLLFIPEGRWPETSYFTHKAWYYAALISIPLSLAAALLAPWLSRSPKNSTDPAQQNTQPALSTSTKRLLILSTLISVLLSLWISLPRMTHSLWGDENENFRNAAVGYHFFSPKLQKMRYREMTLEDAAWRYKRDPNNHQLYAVLGHLTHNKLGGLNTTDPHRPYMTEWKYRLPALFATLLCIPLIGWLCVRLRAPFAAHIAMPLLALHPWFIRYSTEARGYTLTFALLLIATHGLISALHSGKRRYWILFGLSLALICVSYLGWALGCILLGVTALIAILAGKKDQILNQLGGLSTGAIAALLFWIPAYFPCIATLFYYLEHNEMHLGQTMDTQWIKDEIGYISHGISTSEWHAANPNSIAAADLPLPYSLTLGILTLLLLAGSLRLALKTRLRWLLIALLLPAPLMISLAFLRETFIYPWYLTPVIPSAVLLTALGASWPLQLFPQHIRSYAALPLSLLLILPYAYQTHDQRHILRHNSTEPLREAVQTTRTRINPFLDPDPDVITIGFHGANKGYDEHRIDIANAAELRQQIQRARSHDKRLYVDIGQVALAERQNPAIFRLLNNPQLFSASHVIWSGQDVQNTRNLYTLLPPKNAPTTSD